MLKNKLNSFFLFVAGLLFIVVNIFIFGYFYASDIFAGRENFCVLENKCPFSWSILKEAFAFVGYVHLITQIPFWFFCGFVSFCAFILSRVKPFKIRKEFLYLCGVLFIGIVFLSSFVSYATFEISKDGEFCDYKQGNDFYDFMIDGKKCDFLINGLVEPVAAFFIFQIIIQGPLWLLYGCISLILHFVGKCRIRHAV